MIVIVMGVSGAGKTVVGRELAQQLGAIFVEGDDHHPQSNVAKMRAGIPLTDQDRYPWLDEVGAEACRISAQKRDCVITCSALKYAYRERLMRECPKGDWCFLLLSVSRATLAERLAKRKNHFMSPELLDSQLETLEPLRTNEPGAEIDAEPAPSEVVQQALNWLTKSRGATET